MSDQPVLLEVSDGVATVTLNRPEAMNSLDIATKEALLEALRSVAADEAVRCVVLTGTGRAFCVGQDLKEHVGLLESGSSDALFTTVDKHYNPIVTLLTTMPKPVVAAVQGVAAGAGASLAFACDFRILADPAGFNLAFTGVALSCDTGASWTLQRIVGRAKALEMLYFPHHVLPAGPRPRPGHPRGAGRRLRRRGGGLAGRWPPGRPWRSARSAARSPTPPGASFEDAVAFESEMMTLTGSTRDHRTAVDAFLAKEKPVFEGR